MHAYELNGARILEFSVNDAEVSAALDSSALISLAIEHQAALVILPASEVDGAFFQLKTGVAGDLIQKFVNYRLRLAIIGDVEGYAERSTALRNLHLGVKPGKNIVVLSNACRSAGTAGLGTKPLDVVIRASQESEGIEHEQRNKHRSAEEDGRDHQQLQLRKAARSLRTWR